MSGASDGPHVIPFHGRHHGPNYMISRGPKWAVARFHVASFCDGNPRPGRFAVVILGGYRQSDDLVVYAGNYCACFPLQEAALAGRILLLLEDGPPTCTICAVAFRAAEALNP